MKKVIYSIFFCLMIVLTMSLLQNAVYADELEQSEFKVDTDFNLAELVPKQILSASVTATNTSVTAYEGVKDVLVLVALYDRNNTMFNVSYISKGIPFHGTEMLSAGFKLPSDTGGYSAKCFMWDGKDLKTSNMIPISNVVMIPAEKVSLSPTPTPISIPTAAPTLTPTSITSPVQSVTPTPTSDITWSKNLDIAQDALCDIAYGNGVYVAVGREGAIKVSSDATHWNNICKDQSVTLFGIVWGQEQFVAVGLNGNILTSPDGKVWIRQISGTENHLWKIFWDGRQYITIGYNGTILTSQNGKEWSKQNSGTTEMLYGICRGENQYVVVGEKGTLLTSQDGVAWISKTKEEYGRLWTVVWGNNQFIAYGTRGEVVSTDGELWVQNNQFIDSRGMLHIDDIMWDKNKYIVVGSDLEKKSAVIYSSTDGVAWTLRFDKYYYGAAVEFYGVTCNENQYVVVGGNGTILTSPDGISWTEQVRGEQSVIYRVTTGGKRFVAVGGKILTSSDGEEWAAQDPGTECILDVTWGNNQFVCVGTYGTILTSQDGITWNKQISGTDETLNSVKWSGNQFIAMSINSKILASSDGVNWTNQTVNALVIHDTIIKNGNQYTAMSLTGVQLTSNDGITWSFQSSCINKIIGNGEIYVAIGNDSDGTIYTSKDQITWENASYKDPSDMYLRFYDIIWNGSKFVAVGDWGVILTSTDGVSWSREPYATRNLLNSITWDGKQFVAVGERMTIVTGKTQTGN